MSRGAEAGPQEEQRGRGGASRGAEGAEAGPLEGQRGRDDIGWVPRQDGRGCASYGEKRRREVPEEGGRVGIPSSIGAQRT